MKHSWVEVDLGILDENIKSAMAKLRPQTSLMFIVKANAYGHGLVPVAVQAAKSGVKWFGVAYLEEALAVREVLPDVNIVVLGVVEPGDVPALLDERIIPIVVSEDHARALGERAIRAGRILPVHLKIDTGMGRLGFDWERVPEVSECVAAVPGLDLQGICTHFAAVKPSNMTSARTQMDHFFTATSAMDCVLGRKLFRHVSSSRAFLYAAEWDMDAVRTGIILYGYGARAASARTTTRPILQWKASVVQVKKVPANFPVGYYSSYITSAPTAIATLCVGYADGYNRLLGNKGHVLIRGRRHRVVGRISMNWVTVDVGADSGVEEGDEVVLIGRQGSEIIWADELATICGTIPYEILTDINPMLERRYLRAEKHHEATALSDETTSLLLRR